MIQKFNQLAFLKSFLLLFVGITLVITACVLTPTNLTVEKPVIGVIAPLSGPYAKLGNDLVQGVQVFMEDHPEINVIIEDDRSDPKMAVTSATKLLEVDQAKIIIGPLGPVATWSVEGSLHSLKNASVLVLGISLCTNEFQNFTNVLCSYPGIDGQVESAFDFISGRGFHNGYLFTETGALGEYFAESSKIQAQLRGIKLSGLDFVDLSHDKSLATYATKIVAANPDFIYIALSDYESGYLLKKSLKEQGSNATVLFIGEMEDETLKQFGKILNSTYFPGYISDSYTSSFTNKFQEKYNKKPAVYSALSYELISGAYQLMRNQESGAKFSKNQFMEIMNYEDFAIPGFRYNNSMVTIPLITKEVIDGKFVELKNRE